MKKMSKFAMLVLATVSLAGCPQFVMPSISPEVLNDLMASATLPVASNPSPVNLGDNKETEKAGTVTVQGDLYEGRGGSSEKSLNRNDVVDSLIGEATGMNFYFYPVTETEPPVPVSPPAPVPTGKAGKGWSPPMSFELKVEDGRYFGEFTIPAGEYNVNVSIHDMGHNTLFYANSHVNVVASQESVMYVMFYLAENFSYNFKVAGLPGQYPDYGQAIIVAADGTSYYGSFYRYSDCQCEEKGKSLNTGDLVFDFWLPINFDGASDEAVLMVISNDNLGYASALDFNILDAVGVGVFEIDYTIPENTGGVWLETSFAEYPEESGKG